MSKSRSKFIMELIIYHYLLLFSSTLSSGKLTRFLNAPCGFENYCLELESVIFSTCRIIIIVISVSMQSYSKQPINCRILILYVCVLVEKRSTSHNVACGYGMLEVDCTYNCYNYCYFILLFHINNIITIYNYNDIGINYN